MVNCKVWTGQLLRRLLYGLRSVDRGIDFTTEADLPYVAPFGRAPVRAGLGRIVLVCARWDDRHEERMR